MVDLDKGPQRLPTHSSPATPLCPPLQARSYDEASSSPLGWYLRNAQTRALSHPLPVSVAPY